MIHKPPPIRIPILILLRRRGVIKQGSTLWKAVKAKRGLRQKLEKFRDTTPSRPERIFEYNIPRTLSKVPL